ncbi:MAG: GIY-YIG nuclease family protein [Patescibacteria group bacterium]
MYREHHYYIYIMSNFKRTVLYIGVSNNLVRRVIEHKYGLGSGFTSKYKLKYLIYYEEYQYIQEAIQREKELKGWLREKKINLIKSTNLEMKDLSDELLKDFKYEEIQEIISNLKDLYK